MVIPPLPDDTIIDILEYLQDDRGSLYNCLFINHFWCQRVVRLLWRQPFYIPIERCSSLLHTYLLCLNDEEQRSLIPFNIALQNYKRPMFLYSSYLAELDSFFIDRAIVYFLYKEESPRYFIHVSEGVNFIYDHSQTEDYHRIRQLTSTFWHMLLRSCVKVNYLGLGSLGREPIHYIDVPDNLQIFLNSKSIFSHIKKLYLNPVMSQNSIAFLKYVPSICSNIRKLVFHELKLYSNYYPQIIVNIIKAQPYIEDLDFLSFKKYGGLIISELTSLKLDFLNSLKFSNFSFSESPLILFSNFKLLKKLELIKCDSLDIVDFNYLPPRPFFINELILGYNNWDKDIDAKFISKIAKNLRTFSTGSLTNSQIIQIIMNKCPNIINIEFSIDSSRVEFDIISTCLSKMKTLESLYIHILSDVEGYNFQLFGENLPHSLRSFKFGYTYNSSKILNDFLMNCNVPLESLYISFHNININHLDCLVNFANRCTTLREVGLEDIQDQSQCHHEKLDIIEKLRQLNIKVVIYFILENHTVNACICI
ncbi:14214_t:CDS:2 [Dentiscutata erythropus]|uniref:14214_t:CDS:1 n=1 Tax=Dentiscutata erythropus TaxID=1348616 RepID=A0A9N9NHD9_9GLOM|nr:14214_t:CDS:2 [Dentiscutata erythropus]